MFHRVQVLMIFCRKLREVSASGRSNWMRLSPVKRVIHRKLKLQKPYLNEQILFSVNHIINLRRTWEKLLLAARAIAAIENPADVCVISARPYGQRAVLKFASHTGATPVAGRFTPGTFTNQIQVRQFYPKACFIFEDVQF